jgi:hypothetical protein
MFCDRCGGELTAADRELATADRHDACAAARALEPPRYCPTCRRRLKVQVLPIGWRAVCVEHGQSHS